MAEENQNKFKGKYFGATGRRKESVARVRLYKGSGQMVVNGKALEEYFTSTMLREKIFSPFDILGLKDKFDISVVVTGGGKTGQRDAIIHGISRSLLEVDEGYKTTLKKGGFLTRDPRVKERKKYGLKRARKAPQFSKR